MTLQRTVYVMNFEQNLVFFVCICPKLFEVCLGELVTDELTYRAQRNFESNADEKHNYVATKCCFLLTK
jgi:hypothetical protein